jgi:MarR-like DNA-binding transcriptional regulator SgrR of sgrS sRNA
MRWTVFRRFAISCVLLVCALPAVARTRPHYGGALRVETAGDPWQLPDGFARRLVFDGLTRIDANGSVQPALAVGWETDSGDHRWEFRLRSSVRFHDGSSLTATAVVASLNLTCNGNCPWTAVHAVGSSVVFTSDSPMPNLQVLLAGDEFLIALVVAADGTTPPGNIGTGPFQVASSVNGVLSLKANEASWQGRPFVDTIEIRAHRAIHDQWLDLSLGRADVVEVPVEMIRQAQQQKLKIAMAPHVELLALKTVEFGALANPMVRGAIAFSIDRGAIANVIFQKQGEVTASVLPQGLSGFACLYPTDRDLSKAQSLRGGLTVPTLTIAAESDGVMQLAAQRIALNLHEAGLNAVVAAQGPNSARADLTLRRFPLAGTDPSAVLDEVLRSAGDSLLVADANPTSLYKAERSFLDQHTLIPLVDLPRAYALGPRVRDLHLIAEGLPDLAGISVEDAP